MRRSVTGAIVVAALIAAVVSAVVLNDAPADAVEVETPFVDDDWSVHEADINAIAAAEITLGCNPPANDRFCPGGNVTRGQMAAFLVRAFGLTDRGSITFVDDDHSVFEADIERLAAAGIAAGCNPPHNTRFCPDAPLTRAQMASLLARTLNLEPQTAGPFVDVAPSIHAQDINAIAAKGITRGCNPPANDRFCPAGLVSRAQMASFLVRALDLSPQLNRVVLHPGSSCSRDETLCTAGLTLPTGRNFVVREGWHHATPFAAGEADAFRSGGTRFDVTLNGAPVPTTFDETTSAGLAERRWSATIAGLSPGIHTLRGTWRWDGSVNLTVVLTIEVN